MSELHIAGEYEQIEDYSAAADGLSPGSLAAFDASGDVIAHDEAPDNDGNGSALGYFVFPNVTAGQTADDDYNEDENVTLRVYTPGSRIDALVSDNEDLDGHVPLESAGDGSLQEHSGVGTDGDGTDVVADNLIVAYTPPEGLDTSGETGATLQEVVIA